MTALTDPPGVSFHGYTVRERKIEWRVLQLSRIRDFIKKTNQFQADNHEVIVKHVRGKLSIRIVLIGQCFTGSQNEIHLDRKDSLNTEQIFIETDDNIGCHCIRLYIVLYLTVFS